MQQLAGLIDLYGKQIVQQSNQIHAVTRVKFASPDVPGPLKKFMRQLQARKTEAERAFIELVIITSVGDFRKFTSSRQVVSYLGLSPTRKQSGTNLNSRGPISRMRGCRMRGYVETDESGGKTEEGHHRGYSKQTREAGLRHGQERLHLY